MGKSTPAPKPLILDLIGESGRKKCGFSGTQWRIILDEKTFKIVSRDSIRAPG